VSLTAAPSVRAKAERQAKVLLALGVVPIIPCAVILLWLIGFNAHPHHIGLACTLAAIFVVIMSGSQWLLYHQRMKQARML
jgi:hypothetical protein